MNCVWGVKDPPPFGNRSVSSSFLLESCVLNKELNLQLWHSCLPFYSCFPESPLLGTFLSCSFFIFLGSNTHTHTHTHTHSEKERTEWKAGFKMSLLKKITRCPHWNYIFSSSCSLKIFKLLYSSKLILLDTDIS